MTHRFPADTSLAALVRLQAAQHGNSVALLAPDHDPLTYAGLSELVEHGARVLRASGVTRSSRVALVLPNGSVMAAAFLAVTSCAVCAPLNPSHTASEFRFFLDDIGARVVVIARAEQGPIRRVAAEMGLQVVEVEPDGTHAGRFTLHPRLDGPLPNADFSNARDVGLLLHTSGTTARPKLVPLTHANIIASARSNAAILQAGPTDRCLCVMPMFHVGGLISNLLTTLVSGGSVVCTAGFREDSFFDWIAEFEPSWFTAGPTIHDAILALGEQYRRKAPGHRFRFVRSASAALPSAMMTRLATLYGAPVIEAYGMTEAGRIASNPVPPGRSKIGSVGQAVGCEIAIWDEGGKPVPAGATGEIVVRGQSVTQGYLNNPEANVVAFADGWFRTGDLGRLDDQGYLYIEGRLKEIVNRGGQKIAPREVDEALYAHPAVSQAAAFGIPHPTLGEDLLAAVVPRVGVRPDAQELRAFLLERLSAHKVPSQILFLEAIPKGPTGKVQRYTLGEQLSERLQQSFVAPRTQTERMIEGVWREVLNCGPIGTQDNFFAIGGDSLRATQVMSRLNTQFGTSLPAVMPLLHPTISQLADALDQVLIAEIDRLSDEEVERLLAEGEARPLLVK